MSDYQPRDNSGVLFKNDRREQESHPHAKGTALIDGVEYWVSAWTKEGKNGKFQSLSFQKKDHHKTVQSKRASTTRPSSSFDDTDDVPF